MRKTFRMHVHKRTFERYILVGGFRLQTAAFAAIHAALRCIDTSGPLKKFPFTPSRADKARANDGARSSLETPTVLLGGSINGDVAICSYDK